MGRGLAAGLLLIIADAAPALADPLDRYVREEMQNQHLPGVALAVVRDGKPLAIRTYGESNLELRTPVTADTVFRLASISKQMLAVGMMLLVEDGKLGLDDPVSRYLPDTPPGWSAITVRHALNHTAGFPNEPPGFDQATSDLERVREAYAMPLLSEPGEGFAYSNLGYAVVAEIIRKVSGMPWPEFMAERVFKPLHMDATRTTDLADIVPNRASGYRFRDNATKNVAPLASLRPSGAFLSTLADMMKWDAALSARTLVTQAMQDELWKPATLADGTSTRYGFGWWVDDVGGHRRIRHGGTNPGFRAEYVRFVDERLSVIVLVNGESVRPDDLALEVANRFVPGLSPARRTMSPSPEALQRLAGRYQVPPATVLVIGVDGHGLSIQSADGGAQFHLTAETPSIFFLSKDESYVFTSESGGTMQLEVRSGTATSPGATKLKALKVP